MSLTLAELKEYILLDAGHYIAGMETSLLTDTQIIAIALRELGTYNRYMPEVKTTSGDLYDGKVFTIENDLVIPNNIIDIRSTNYLITGIPLGMLPGAVRSFNWRYEKPVLYFRYPHGNYLYQYMIDHIFIPPVDENDPTGGTFPSIDPNNYFVTMVIAKWMMTVGRARKLFSVSDMPIELANTEMAADGEKMYEEVLEKLKTNSKFHLGILI